MYWISTHVLLCVSFFIGSDSLSGALSPKPYNNSSEELRGESLRRKQGRRRHASAEVRAVKRHLVFYALALKFNLSSPFFFVFFNRFLKYDPKNVFSWTLRFTSLSSPFFCNSLCYNSDMKLSCARMSRVVRLRLSTLSLFAEDMDGIAQVRKVSEKSDLWSLIFVSPLFFFFASSFLR